MSAKSGRNGFINLNYEKCFKSGKLMIPECDIYDVVKSLRRRNPCSYYICADCGSYHLTRQTRSTDKIVRHGRPSKKKQDERNQKKRSSIKRRKRIKPVSKKRKAENEIRAAVLVDLLLERGNGCEASVEEVCTHIAVDGHEKKTRARGGSITDPENILLVCRCCHKWIHDHPREAKSRGLLVASWGDGADLPER